MHTTGLECASSHPAWFPAQALHAASSAGPPSTELTLTPSSWLCCPLLGRHCCISDPFPGNTLMVTRHQWVAGAMVSQAAPPGSTLAALRPCLEGPQCRQSHCPCSSALALQCCMLPSGPKSVRPSLCCRSDASLPIPQGSVTGRREDQEAGPRRPLKSLSAAHPFPSLGPGSHTVPVSPSCSMKHPASPGALRILPAQGAP